MKKKEISKELQKKYNDFISSVELIDLLVNELSFKKLTSPPDSKNISIKVSLKPNNNAYRKTKENTYEITHGVQFKLETINEDESKKKKFFELKVVFKLIYKSEIKLDNEIFELFVRRNIPINIIPFLREIIHNSMYRAGLSPFVLPLIKI